MNNTIFFHVGYPKCASSFLQKCLFNRHREIVYLGRYPTQNVGHNRFNSDQANIYLKDERLCQFYHRLERPNSIDHNFDEIKTLFTDLYTQYAVSQDAAAQKSVVLSSEAMTSVFLGNRDLGVKADRIKRLLPEAKIILVIRKQADIITSQYRDWPFDPRSFEIGKALSIEQWIDIIFDSNEQKGYLYYLSSLNFYRVVQYYEKLFSKENILVVPFEMVKTNLPELGQTLSQYLNVGQEETLKHLDEAPENTGASAALNTARRLRRVFPDELTRLLPKEVKLQMMAVLKKGQKESVAIAPNTKARIEAHFKASNQKLSAEYGLDLETFGYC